MMRARWARGFFLARGEIRIIYSRIRKVMRERERERESKVEQLMSIV